MKTANDYIALTDSARIQAAVDGRGPDGIVIIPPRCCETEPTRTHWLLDEAIRLPENTTVILQNCTLKLSDSCRDNFFRSANCGLGIEDIQTIRNIHIKGEGRVTLQGADHPRATGDSSKILACPCPKNSDDLLRLADWISPESRAAGKTTFDEEHDHSYGTDAGKPGQVQHGDWRGIGILFACVEDFSIENLRIVEPHNWSISLEACSHGRLEHLDFDSCMEKEIDGMLHNEENQDGIDLRNGCHDILINDITGGTGDDIVALTAIADKNGPLVSGTTQSNHIMHSDWTRRERDIHDVIIRNVRGYSKGRCCWMVRLLPADSYIYNVVIDGIVDTSPADYRAGGAVLLGEADGAYGSNPPRGMQHITVTNVTARCGWGILVNGFVADSIFSNIIGRCPTRSAIQVNRKNALENVIVDNVLSANGTSVRHTELFA